MQDCIHRIQQGLRLYPGDKAPYHMANCQLLAVRPPDADTDRCRQTATCIPPGIGDERVRIVLLIEDSDYPIAQ